MSALTPGQVAEIPIGKLLPDPDQPRTHFDEASLKQLGESLARRVLVPLLVRPGARGKFTIVDGERRWRAAKLAGLKVLPVLLASDDSGDDERSLDQVAVNQLREQLTTMEVARMLADLRRRHFATTNDLAAALDKRGLPPMTPKQIQEAIELTELPDWAQEMIDAGGLEASAAAPILVAARHAPALKAVREALAEGIKWRGRVVAADVKRAVLHAFAWNAVDLSRTQSWQREPIVHFNAKVVCKKCEHLVRFDGGLFCLNAKEFERKNEEAKAAGLLPGGKKPQKAKDGAAAEPEADEVKAEKRAQTLEEKARDYLHAYLVRHIVEAIRGGDIDIESELLIWRAMERPGQHSWGGRAAGLKHDAAEAAGVKSLEWMFACKDSDIDDARREAAIEVATELKWRETQVICHELWGGRIDLAWSLDKAFTNLFRKAELVHLATTYKLDLPEKRKSWEACKASELKDALCDQAEKLARPQILQDIYAKVEEPYARHHGWGDEIDDDDEDLEEDAA